MELTTVELVRSVVAMHRLQDGTELSDEVRQVGRIKVRRFNVMGSRIWGYIALEEIEKGKYRINISDAGEWRGAVHTRICPQVLVGTQGTRQWIAQQEQRAYSYIVSAFPEARAGTLDEGVVTLRANSVEYRRDHSNAEVHTDAGIFEITARVADHAHDVAGTKRLIFAGEFHNAKVRGEGSSFWECVLNYWAIGRAQQEIAINGRPVGAV